MSSTTSHQAIYRRWRAQTFGQIVGQEAVVATLRNAVRTGRVAHAILFVGPRGTGKTSLARILAKAINCTNLRDGDPCDACEACVAIREGTTLDVIEIDAASNRGINEVRDLRDHLAYAPTSLRRKVYILDEAHQITRDAWNALLKSLEEPPDFVVFMFASTHPQDFPPAILSRLQRYDVRRLTTAEIEGKLGRILEADGRAAEPGALRLIARLAAGGMRDAESMLDQLLSSTAGILDEQAVRELLGLADAEAVDRFIVALAGHDPAGGIAILDALEDRGRDLRTFLDQVVEGIRATLTSDVAGGQAPAAASLVSAARRLAAIDPSKAGIGGLRLQLELALFQVDEPAGAPRTGTTRGASVAAPTGSPAQSPARPNPVAAPDPSPTRPGPASAPVSAPARPTDGAAAPDAPADAPAASPGSPAPPPAARPGEPRPTPSRPAPAVGAGLDGSRRPEGPRVSPLRADAAPSVEPAPPADDVDPGPGAPPAAAGSDLGMLRELWPQIVAHISAHPPTKPLIVACRPISVEGNIVTLGFPEDQAFLKDVAARRRPNLEAGIGQYLRREVSVRCIATNLDSVAAGTTDADAAFLMAEARRIFAEDIVEADEIR